MVVCEFLLFGHGRDGDIRSWEYDNSGKLEITSRTQLLASGPDGVSKSSYQALDKTDTYIVTAYKSKNDGLTYLIGTTDGNLPHRIDDRIRAAGNLKPSPF